METPLVSQVQLAQSLSNAQILTYSVPQIAYAIRTLNSSSALSNIMKNNYQQYLSLLLQTYGFSKSGLASLTGQTEAQIDDLTIQEAHSLVFEALYLRYNIVEFLSKFNPAGVDKYVAINLPSFEWYRLVKAAIEKSFDQLSIAFSTNLTVGTGGISVVTLTDGTSSIQVQTCSAPSSFVTTVTCLASCLGTTVSEIYQRTMSGYQTLYQTSAVPLMNNKIVLETEKFEDLLARLGTTLGSIDSETVGETIQNRVGLTAEQLRCMYGWSSEFTSFLFGISWRNVSSFRLCGNFVSWPLHRIALALKYSTPSICDVNECVIHKDDCHSNADCRNTIGSFECTCQAGYTGNGKHCEDIIDCVLPPRQYPCDVRAICRDFPGSFICVCPPGLTLNADQRTCDGSSNPTLSSKINTGVIIGVVAAAVVVLIIVIVIVACFLYRKMMQLRDKEQNSGDVPNLAHEAENQATRTLPPVPYSGSAYEEPAEYAQLEDFGRVSNDENYQGLRRGSEQGGSRNSREDVGLGIENEVDYSESGGEELAEYTQLNSSKRVPIDSNYQGLNMHGEFGVLENSVIVLENVMDQRNTYGKQSCNTTTLTI
ncbi:uncharacterized protein LOC114518684 [Dendronephthya gigantea]|uniref:uncharacterized protein LOC114518684 n=1 Tax=Dendronephthya gigantea TaxID=151771 RepID=UPI00106D9356|nr:uncharacterized protein LOC114518684 [Dendronephthya gigantea]